MVEFTIDKTIDLNPRNYSAACKNEDGTWSFLNIAFEQGAIVKIETESFVWTRSCKESANK